MMQRSAYSIVHKEDTIITIADARRVFCVLGVKRWMEERDLDFMDFVKNGISANKLCEIGETGLVDCILSAREGYDEQFNKED